jgi:hypothetical protein
MGAELFVAALLVLQQSDGSRIELYGGRGPCSAPALYGAYIPATGDPIGACWRPVGAEVLVVFLDTDTARIPLAAFKRPTRL